MGQIADLTKYGRGEIQKDSYQADSYNPKWEIGSPFQIKDLLRLYSITEAVKILHIGKNALYELIAEGKIGYIAVGKRKKITYQELLRYEGENTVRKSNGYSNISSNDIERKLHENQQIKNRKNETDTFLLKLKKELT
jgi:excisionase family DNA binding protein